MRDDWDQFTWSATPRLLPVVDEPHGDGGGFAEMVAALWRREVVAALLEADAEFDRLAFGNGTGEPRGVSSWEEQEPTPIERAFAILDPELRHCPLYAAGPPVIYPQNWKA